jgi:acyl-[acyl-carrier-protein]-phospholipid O-acyltransferase / long-chain-fatty-acid--[acyl-carrier-protein] ligase
VVEKLAALTSPAFAHAASSQDDLQRGETVVLFTTDANLTREKLQGLARDNGYPELTVPRKIVSLESLPLLGTGKLDYVMLKQLAMAA